MRASVAVFCLVVCLVVPAGAQPYTFTHFAGTTGGSGAVDATGAAARFYSPADITSDAAGNLYVIESRGGTIRKITPGGAVTTLAGLYGNGGATDLPRHEARFYNARGITIDPAGNLYVANSTSHTIRKVTPGGIVTTFAGSAWEAGTVNGTGAAARFNNPYGIARGPSGDFFVADTDNHTIRRITAAGAVSTYAGGAGVSGTTNAVGTAARFKNPAAVAVDGDGVVYVADTGNHLIRKIATDRTVTTLAGVAGTCGVDDSAGTFCQPDGLTTDASGNVYVTNYGAIRRITPDGVVTTIAGVPFEGGISDGTGPAARFLVPRGITYASDGHLYVTEFLGEKIRRVTLGGVVTTVAGFAAEPGFADGSGAVARFDMPEGVAVDGSGNVYVADRYNYVIRKITSAGVVSTLAGLANTSGFTDSPARFSDPVSLTVDGAGNVYVAEQSTHTIRKITSGGTVSTLAGSPQQSGTTNATGPDARFNTPSDVAVDSDGNVYVTDSENHVIRRITPGGVVSTFAGQMGTPGFANGGLLSAQFNRPYGIAIDSSGDFYVTDLNNYRIRKISGGTVSTFAGAAGGGYEDGPGTTARFYYPTGVDVDGSGNVYVTEAQYNTIRKITSSAVVSTIGGTLSQVGTEDGTGAHARFTWPASIAVDGTGRLYIADRYGNDIRRGVPALTATAAIDDASAPIDLTRQLSTTPATATTWNWSVIRRPTGSAATLSSSSTANPTFTPDIPDLYTFRLDATGGGSRSVTMVSLRAECPSITVGPSSLPGMVDGVAFSQALSASGGTATYRFAITAGSLPPGLTLSAAGLLSGTPSAAGSYGFTVRATDFYGCTGARAYAVIVHALRAPANLVATATGDFTIGVTWSAVSGAVSYSVYRREAGGPLTMVTTTGSTSFSDGPIQNSRSFLYFVRANDSTGEQSGDSNADYGTTVMFADPVLTAGVTSIKAIHVSQLRTAVNAVRLLAGLTAYAFTDSTLAGVEARALHVTQLRTALNQARTALGFPSLSFTDGTLTDLQVRAVHLTQLRSGAM